MYLGGPISVVFFCSRENTSFYCPTINNLMFSFDLLISHARFNQNPFPPNVIHLIVFPSAMALDIRGYLSFHRYFASLYYVSSYNFISVL